MVEEVSNLYRLPNVEDYEDLNLLPLSEKCAALEERVQAISKDLPEEDRQIIHAYISARDDLEVETVKTALRWGKMHYK